VTLPIPSEMTATVGQILTAAQWNSNVRDGINYLLNPPIFLGYQATGQAFTSGVFTSAALDTEIIDTYNGHSTTTNNSRYTAQVAGWYLGLGQFAFPSNTTGARASRFTVNGASPTPLNEKEISPNSGGQHLDQTLGLFFLNVGDYLELQPWQNSGSTLTALAGDTWMAALWVHQ